MSGTHTEESQIIAGAGALGSVTIATNMAGRGVDIKLGGELSEDILSFINHLLRDAEVRDPYTMTNVERLDSLRTLLLEDFEFVPKTRSNGFRIAEPAQLQGLKSMLLEKAASGSVKDEWETLASILYHSGKYPLMADRRVVEF